MVMIRKPSDANSVTVATPRRQPPPAARTDSDYVSRPIPTGLLAAPLLATLTLVMSVYVDRGQVLEALPRPLVAAAIVVLGIQWLAIGVTRRAELGTAVALVAVLAFFDPRIALLAVLISLLVRELAKLRRWDVSWHFVRTPIAVLFLVSTVRLVASPAFVPGDLLPRSAAAQAAGTAESPDMFLILLDGYPRSDTLTSFGYDNSWFEAELLERGFTIAPKSHGNYTFTYVVVPTLLHMRHAGEIDELRNVKDEWVAQRRAIRDAIASAPVFPYLEARGYEIVSAGAWGTPVSLSPVARYIDNGAITQFERELLASTAVGRLMPAVPLNQHRERVLGAFEAAESIASDPGQTFMFAHILSPHVPFVFDRDGGLPDLPCADPCDSFIIYSDQSGMTQGEFERAYTDQIHYLNQVLLASLDRIIAASPNAPVILFSDHGTRSQFELSEEWYATFFASRTPGHRDPFQDDARPIEILPVLFNEYFGENFAIPPDETYFSPSRGARPFYLERWAGGEPLSPRMTTANDQLR